MRVYGLTGGIATGKSTVARLLYERHGVAVIDADRIARRVVEPGTPVLEAIRRDFGDEILRADGSLDRSAMRARIGADPAARGRLEALTHPAIYREIEAEIGRLRAAGERFAVVEAALLVETGGHARYDGLIVVTCSPRTQIARLLARDGKGEADAKALLAAQMPLADKERAADHLVRNDGDETALARAVDALWREISRQT